MKVVILTSNALRHKFVANTLSRHSDDALIVSECKPNDATKFNNFAKKLSDIQNHFNKRYENEKKFFAGNDMFYGKILPILHNEVNLDYVYNVIKDYKPDMMFVFGSSIIREPLLSFLPLDRFINLHLGISPYYRGSGTNFWPFVNKELEYVGSTILHIDEGIDTGDIIAHVRPKIELGDDVHSVGCKVIKSSVDCLTELMDLVKDGKELNRIKQWEGSVNRFYEKKDFNEKILLKYKKNLEDGLIEEYLKNPPKKISLINLGGRGIFRHSVKRVKGKGKLS